MKRNILIALILISTAVTGENWKKITDRTTIQEDKIYLIVSENKDKNKKTVYYLMNTYYKQKIYEYSESNTLPQDLYSYYSFQFKKTDNNYWYMYNVYENAYINDSSGYVNEEANANKASLCKFESQYIWTQYISKATNIAGWDMLSMRKGYSYYYFYAFSNFETDKKKEEFLIPSIYELTTFTLDETKDLPAIISPISVDEIILKKKFVNDVNNTLLLPCDVPNYKNVFGNNVTAYQYFGINGENITFTEITDNDLMANTPYIIKGSAFKDSPYSINSKTVYPANDDMTYNNGIVTGTFKTTKAEKDGYIFTKNGLRKYNAADNNLSLEPYKWYFTISNSNNAKLNTIQNNTDGISKPITDIVDGPIHTLQGVKVAKDNNSKRYLHSGIYIQGRKKIRIQ